MNQPPQKKQVLLLEDEATQRHMLVNQLQRLGYEPLQAENGEEGLKLWCEEPDIRLIITDLMMPKIDGFEVIETIRQEEHRYNYIIVLTALEDRKSLIRALEIGADDYLHKPVLPDELKLRLDGANRLIRLEGFDDLTFGLAELAEKRSNETGMHLRRVQEYCLILGEYLRKNYPSLRLNNPTVKDISTVSILHDIGKVGIPDSILHKPDRLTEKEFELMKTHTTIGGELLKGLYQKNSSSFLKIAYELTIGHHEKWDGSGYPEGLAGEEIPLPARIMALADVYDALTSRRCYKDVFPSERAKSIIESESGKQFDPLLVEAFLTTEDEWIKVQSELNGDYT